MKYPLPERIGDPDLLVGRKKEFDEFQKWISLIPKRLSKSRAILARRKSGKTAFVQRLFNELWSENSKVIPIYMNFPERKIWLPDFAENYYRTFISQYISFIERDEGFVRNPLELKEIRAYAVTKSFNALVKEVDSFIQHQKNKKYDYIWELAYSAPHRFAGTYDHQFLVIMDEFQNINANIYLDRNHRIKDETLAGSWHEYAESKIAPILVTGSYVGWLLEVIDTYLEAGRLKRFFLNPYLNEEEGLEAVYKYAEAYKEPITNETAMQINQLCMADPFFISCVIQSQFEGKNLTTQDGVVNTVNFEITDKLSEMSMTWGEYIELSLKRVNDVHAKHILLTLSKDAAKEWTPNTLKEELKLDLTPHEIHERLRIMVKADLIREGSSDIDYHGLTDGTLYLILRSRFEKEIKTFAPDLRVDFNREIEKLKQDKHRLQGKLNYLTGKYAEYQLATDMRCQARFFLSQFFDNVQDDTELHMIGVRTRVKFQRADGKEMEIDVMAVSSCGKVIIVEVKKTKVPLTIELVKEFIEKIDHYRLINSDKPILPAILSTGGFTPDAIQECIQQGIAFKTS